MFICTKKNTSAEGRSLNEVQVLVDILKRQSFVKN